MNKEVNLKSGTCNYCKTLVVAGRGYRIKERFNYALYHTSCYNKMKEEEKKKLKDALKVINKLNKFK